MTTIHVNDQPVNWEGKEITYEQLCDIAGLKPVDKPVCKCAYEGGGTDFLEYNKSTEVKKGLSVTITINEEE